MLITKTLKLVILCVEFEIIILTPGTILPNTVSPEGPLWLELRRQDNFLCVY